MSDKSEFRFSGGQWYSLAVLALVYTCHLVDRTIVMIVLEPVKHEFGLSDFQLGVFSGVAFAAGTLVTTLPLGSLADRGSRKALLAGCIAVWSGLTLLCGMAVTYPMLLLARFGVGMGEGGLQPAALSLVSDAVRAELRGKAIAIIHLGLPLGTLLGFAAGGWVGQHHGWRAALLLVGAPGLLLALLVLLTLREPARAERREGDPLIGYTEFFRSLPANPAMLHLLAAMATLWLCTTTSSAWTAPFLMRTHHVSIVMASIILAGTVGGGGIAGNLLAARLSGSFAAGRPDRLAAVACAGALIFLACSMIALFAGALWVVVAALFVQMASFHLVATPGYSIAMTLADSRLRGRTAAILAMGATVIGYGLGPQLAGALSDGLRPYAGDQSLRYAMFTMMLILLWSATHLYLARQALLEARCRGNMAKAKA